MECGGGCLVDEGVGPLELVKGADPCPEALPSVSCLPELGALESISVYMPFNTMIETYLWACRRQWRKSWAVGELLKEPSKRCTTKVSQPFTPPDMPPEVFQTKRAGIKKPSEGGCID